MAGRAAIYLRVSKGERHTENQRPDVERVVSMRGLELVAEYEEKASAARVRPVFDRMVRDAHQGAFDVLVVWALDRFGRSMVGNLEMAGPARRPVSPDGCKHVVDVVPVHRVEPPVQPIELHLAIRVSRSAAGPVPRPSNRSLAARAAGRVR